MSAEPPDEEGAEHKPLARLEVDDAPPPPPLPAADGGEAEGDDDAPPPPPLPPDDDGEWGRVAQ